MFRSALRNLFTNHAERVSRAAIIEAGIHSRCDAGSRNRLSLITVAMDEASGHYRALIQSWNPSSGARVIDRLSASQLGSVLASYRNASGRNDMSNLDVLKDAANQLQDLEAARIHTLRNDAQSIRAAKFPRYR